MTIEIWSEGYSIQGGSGKAHLVAVYEADSFNEAVEKYNKTVIINQNRRSGSGWRKLKADYRDGFWRIWGCRLFDNEADARKSFG